jgi:hypothetical protein
VIELEDGTFQGMQYIVGKRESVERVRHCSMEGAIEAGKAYLTPMERWVDVTDECKLSPVSVTDYTSPLIMLLYNGCTIHPGKDRDFMLEDGKVFKKKKYYG